MRKLTSQSRALCDSWVKAGMIFLVILAANAARAQDSFTTPEDLGDSSYGTVANDNTSVLPDVGAPNIAGFSPNAPLWYKWTAPQDGEVELDTIGSADDLFGYPLDTVLGVYQGASIGSLNQIAANDDLYPVNSSLQEIVPGFSVLSPENASPLPDSSFGPTQFYYTQPFHGPSHLRFTAKAGQTYYFAVDTKGSATSLSTVGNVVLNWAYKSSGVFRFASEDMDFETGLPLYQTAETESLPPVATPVDRNSVVGTYYNYNAPGVLVTVTRTAGSTGRAVVDYTTEDGTNLPSLSPTDMPGVAGVDYTPVSGQLVFDDFEMSKTILIPILHHNVFSAPGDQTNRVFGIKLIDDGGQTSPHLDYLEDGSSVSPPRVDPVFGTAVVKILNTDADPYGPDMVPVVTTNSDSSLTTNMVVAAYPTNLIFNFEKANYRVAPDINDTNIAPYNWATVTIYVERGGTNGAAATVNYRINNWLDDNISSEEYNNQFPLQPGSDYAIPPAAHNGNTTIRNYGTNNYDFDATDGTLSFPAEPAVGSDTQPIHITIPVSKLTKFNKDFRIDLYRMVKVGNDTVPEIPGMNSEATVTILFNDENPPAGSVDEFYNADFNQDLAVLPSSKPATTPDDDSNPGVGGPLFPGQVYSIAVLTNDEALIGGDFQTYDGAGRIGLALVNTNGQLDTQFLSYPHTGVSGDITHQGNDSKVNAVAASGNEFYIGGNFTAYDSQSANCIARLTANGLLDSTFNTGSGANGPVRAVAAMPNGEVLIGGDFTQINGQARNYIAMLNTNGDVDQTFDPSNLLSGPVYAITLPIQSVPFNDSAFQTTNETDQAVKFGAASSGALTINFDMQGTTNDLRVFYGDTNVTAASGVLVYDTGSISGAGAFSIPVGPTGGLTTNIITVVMNQGGAQSAASWSYNGTITFPNGGSGIMIGGNFSVSGQPYQNIARLNTDGSLDTSFAPTVGVDGIVHSLSWQPDGKILAGGEFTHANGLADNYIARFNADGSVDTTDFFIGTGADDVVYTVNAQYDGTIYLGGAFDSINGTRRSGFARLNSDGTVDTTFMDTAYNQFAGLKKIYSYDSPAVFASAVQNNGGVLIGGSFLQVGGGQADPNVANSLDDELYYDESFADTNLWVEPKSRDGFRNRTGFARLIGGSTPGPGNIGLAATSYSQDKSKSSLAVSLVRTNGTLGPISANFSVTPGLALAGQDYQYQSAPPLDWIAWDYISNPTRQREDGLWGSSGSLIDALGLALPKADAPVDNLSTVTVNIIPNQKNPGNLNAGFQLANPSLADTFYLGGEGIPLGAALGESSAPLTLVDDTTYPGQFGFVSSSYIATNLSASIAVVRSNGTFGPVSMRYSTVASNSTAVANVDYRPINNALLVFNTGITSTNFNVTVLNNGSITNVEKTVYLSLSQLGTTPGATFGISNAVLRLISPSYPGYVTLSASNYTGTVSSGAMTFTVNRIVGSLGTVSVQYATTNGPSAVSGVDFIGSTNTLTWNSGDVAPKTISIPLLNQSAVGGSKQFGVKLFNPTNNGVAAPSLMGVISNASLTISNDNSYGTLQFSAPSYNVNEDGGYATITVTRSGGVGGTVSADFATSAGANTSAGNNYYSTNGTLVFAPGVTAESFRVYIRDDGIQDPAPSNFYFDVALSNPTNAALGSPASAQVQILDAQSYNRSPGSPDTGFNTDDFNGNVFGLSLNSSGQILVGGNFTDIGPTSRGRIARLNTDGTLDAGFLNGLSGANAAVNAVVAQTDDRILIGGAFTTVDDSTRYFIARLMTDGTLDTSFNPGSGADNVVHAIAETFAASGANLVRQIYIGGAFGSVNGNPSAGIERLNNDGTVDYSFNPGLGADGPVYAIAVYPTNSIYWGKVLVGGAFSHFNGATVGNLVRLNSDGSLDTNFDAAIGLGANDTVRALAVQVDGAVLVGGSFTNFNNTIVSHLIRLNTDGSLDTNFASAISNVNGSVEAIAVQPDNRIVVSGQFTMFNGVARNRITRLQPDGTTDLAINFGSGANGDVDALLIQPDGMIVLGGAFSQYDGQEHDDIARIYGGSVVGSGAFEFTSGNYQVEENGIVAAITVRRTGGTSGPNPDGSGNVSVHFATSDGTATNGVNYIGVSTNLVFPPGESLETVLVPVLDDFVVTPDLTNYLTLSAPTAPATLGNQSTATLTILNDDTAVSFSSADYSQGKNISSGVATIDIVRSGGASGMATVNFSTTTNGTAVIGTDYYPTNETVTFAPGVSDVQVQVPIINNGLVEGNKTVGLTLANAVNTTLASPSNAVLTIIDTVSAPGQLFFSATNFTANSSDGTGYLTVLRTNGSSGSVTVTYNLVAGTAQPGLDYVDDSPAQITFGSKETSASIPVQLVNNRRVRGNVSLSAVLSNPTGGATLTTPSSATLTIMNTNVGFAFVSATNYFRETNGFVPVFVQRLGATNVGATVDFSTVENGTARSNVNYGPVSGALIFVPGEVLKTITLPLLDDPDVTGDLTLGMTLTDPSAGTFLASPSNSLIVIQDADAGLSFTNSAMSVSKNIGQAVVTVVCSNPSVEPSGANAPLSVDYATSDGSALAGVDYTKTTGTLLFTNGIGTNTFIVPIINNSLVTGNHFFNVSLTNATAPGQLLWPSNQTVTIVDANSGFSFSSPVYTVLKTGVAATITVVRTDNTNQLSSVNYSTSDGTAVGGTDYFATNGVLVFDKGVTSQSFTVNVIANSTVQPDKTVLLQLSNPTNAYLIAPYAATLTIHDTSGSLVVPAGSTLVSESLIPNGIIDPNESVTMLLALRASGGTNIPNVYATLLATNGVTSPSPNTPMNYGPLAVNGPSVSKAFSFTGSGTNGQQIAATLLINNGVTNIGIVEFTYTLGTWTNQFYNPTNIIIPDIGMASPYPSTITVSNLGGTLVKATVTLTNLYHSYPQDVNVLLVSPSARDTMLMSHAGGATSVSKVTLTFADSATNSLPQGSALTTSTNKPTSYNSPPVFP